MSVERTIRCDGPDCVTHVVEVDGSEWGWERAGFVKARQHGVVKHFCSWDCTMRFAATLPPKYEVEMDDVGEGG